MSESLYLLLLVARHQMPHPLLPSFLCVSAALPQTLPLEVRHPIQVLGSHQYYDQDSLISNLGLAQKKRKDPHVDGLFDRGKLINSSRIGSIACSTNDSYRGIPTQ